MKELQASCELIALALTSFGEGLSKAIPHDGEREQALRALHEMRHNVIHLGREIGDARAPLGLSREQREAVKQLLDLAGEVASDTIETERLANARVILTPLIESHTGGFEHESQCASCSGTGGDGR